MTMPFSPSRTVFHGNGVATTFPFAFKVWSADQLTVTVTMPGATEQTEEDVTAQCSISLTESGGSVVYLREGSPLPAGAVLSITRDMPFVQEVDLVSASRFDPQVIEDALDQAAAERQQLREGLSRAVKLSATSATTPEDMVEDIFDARDQAEQSATGAAAYATAAADSATAAASSATTASQKATTAADSADLASQKATAAADSAANAATQADNAAGSATAATDSAIAAASSATTATQKAAAAASSATAAAGSATTATQKATAAASSATAAAGSATTASQKAIAAADSATAAADSADLSRRWASEDADVPVQSGEYSAKHYAHKAKDAVPDNLVSRVEAVEGKTQSATTTTRGIGRIATAANALPGSTITNGPAFLDASTFKVSATPTANVIPKADASGSIRRYVYELGEFYYFRHPDLRVGFAPLTGGLISNCATAYPEIWAYLATTAGAKLCCTEDEWQAMSTATWATLADGTTVGWEGIGGVPFYVRNTSTGQLRLPDLRGMYAEAAGFDSLGVAGVHGDAVRNITGVLQSSKCGERITEKSGAFGSSTTSAQSNASHASNTVPGSYLTIQFDTSLAAPTALKNQPRAWGALACGYLGLPVS